MDPGLNLDSRISAVMNLSSFQLRQVAKIKPFLSRQHFEMIIHAFVSIQLDYCSTLYVWFSASTITCLQMVQNAAACLLSGTNKREHVSPIWTALHWLPIRFRIHFNGLAPALLSLRGVPRRSANQLLPRVPKMTPKLREIVVAPKLWNDLPLHIRHPSASVLYDLLFHINWCVLISYFYWPIIPMSSVLLVLYIFCLCALSILCLILFFCTALWSTGFLKCFINKDDTEWHGNVVKVLLRISDTLVKLYTVVFSE